MYRILEKIDSPEDLKALDQEACVRLAVEIRDFLLQHVSQTGGHLASNLGIVELSIALHRMYQTPEDKIIFDVGHQGYVHKILTGRMEKFHTLRQTGGISGFLKRSESCYDCFEAGHSSTSISAAVGFSQARRLQGAAYEIVAVIGDGALTGGMAFEALNHLGHLQERVTIVLNDNEMSISENVGGLSMHLSQLRTSAAYYRLKDEAHQFFDHLPKVGSTMTRSIQRVKSGLKKVLLPGVLFEELGLTYIGPVNGHDLAGLEEALAQAKRVKGPALVHVLTQKGKGFLPAEQAPDLYHGVGKFDLKLGVGAEATHSYSNVFGRKLVALAQADPRIVAVTAAMPSGTGLSLFREQFPERYIDVGIAEQHAVTLCAGMACGGLKPVFAVYSTFLQRAYDQVLHDVCQQNLPVVFAVDRAGLVGQDGETHHGVFDIAYLKAIPNITLLTPMDGGDLELCLEYALGDLSGPVAIRYPRGIAPFDDQRTKAMRRHPIDRPYLLYPSINEENGERCAPEQRPLVILSIGAMSLKALAGIDLLSEAQQAAVALYHIRCIKPLDIAQILTSLQAARGVMIIEDGVQIGGIGETIQAQLMEAGLHKGPDIQLCALPTEFIVHGDAEALYGTYGLDAPGIAGRINTFLKYIQGVS